MASPLLEFGHASIAISLLLGILCVGRIRAYDVHEKEPYLKLFLVAIYGGLVAAAASLLLYRLASRLGFGSFHSWYGFLLFVGPIEEGAKFLGLRLTRAFHGGRLNEATDGVIYMSSVALGFSLIENFMYANAGVGNGHLLWLRLLLATPGHILFSFPMGLSHSLARGEGWPRWTVAASYGLACLSHGLYNILCSAPLGLLLAPVFLLVLWMGLLAVLRYAHATSPSRTTFGAVLERLPPAFRRGLRCRKCGNAGEMAPAPVPTSPGIGRPPHRPEPLRWRDLALAALGMALCAVWGVSHLAAHRLVPLHPALSQTWHDSTLSVAYPRGWTLSVWTRDDGRQVSVNLEAEGRAAMAIRGQHWDIVPEVAAERTLQEVIGTLGASERSRRPLARWGRYRGSGAALDMRSAKGGELGLSVFAHTGGGRSFVAVEMVQGRFREPLRPGMDLVRRTLRLKPPPAPPAAGPDPSAAAGAGFAPDSSVTRALRSFLARGEEDLPAPAPAPGTGLPAARAPAE